MVKNVLKISFVWVLPLAVGVALIWLSVLPVAAAESLAQNPVPTPTTFTEPVNLYDTTTLPRKVRKIVFRAASYGKRGEFQKAADLLRDHLAEHPDQDHYLVRLHLAQNLADLDQTAAARDQYRQSVELEPRLDRGWFGLADTAYKLQDYSTAAEAFIAGYDASPTKPADVLAYAAAAYLMAEQPANALPIFARLVSGRVGSPQLNWYQGLVIAAARLETPQKADAAVKQMLATFPDDAEAWYLGYQHYAGEQNFAEAAVALSIVGYLRPLTAGDEKQLGDLYLVAGVPYLASKRYAVSAATDTSAAATERLATALVAAHETDSAMVVLEKSLATRETPRLWSLLGDIHYLRQEYAPARSAFAHIAASDETGRAWLMQGYCALELGEKEAALDLLGRATTFPEQEDMAQILLQRALKL